MSNKRIGPTFFPPLGPAKMAGAIDPKGWDRAVLGGQVVPGYATITRGGVKLKADPKKKAGADGTRPTYHGLDPQPIEMEIETFSDDDRENLAETMAQYTPIPGRTPKPVSFDHPSLRHLGISTVQIVEVGALIPTGPNKARMRIGMEHWLPPKAPGKSATATPTRAVRNVRREAAQKAHPPNPPPTAQPGFAAPPRSVSG